MTIVRLKLEGYLTVDSLLPGLNDARRALDALPSGMRATLLIDCLGMEDYSQTARAEFVRFATKHRHRLGRILIATEKFLWHMVIRAMSLASGVEMRPFMRVEEAETYARAQRVAEARRSDRSPPSAGSAPPPSTRR